VAVSNITGPAMFRTIEQYSPTLIIDEADTFIADKDELRGVLNAGHRRNTAYVARVVGEDHEVKLFPTWAPKAIAAIGKLADTLEDRSIVIRMKRRAPGEKVERFRVTECEAIAKPIRQRAARWAQDNIDAVRDLRPVLPESLNDRALDNWTPLFSVAQLAGAEWEKRARAAALALCGEVDEAEGSAIVDLLGEFRKVFESQDRITSAGIVKRLTDDPDGRWIEWRHGEPITQRQVARLLAPLGIRPRTIRIGNETPKGYLAEWFKDAFLRYPIQKPHSDPQQPQQDNDSADLDLKNDPTQDSPVADRKTGLSACKVNDVADVADEKGVSGGNGHDSQGFDWVEGKQKESADEYWARIKAEHAAKRAAGVRN